MTTGRAGRHPPYGLTGPRVGFSSLERLEQLPITVLKIDRRFVERLGQENGTRLLRGFHSLAAAMDIETIVEGVETLDQLQTLRTLGYRLGQGFQLARPLEVDAIAELLARQTLRA